MPNYAYDPRRVALAPPLPPNEYAPPVEQDAPAEAPPVNVFPEQGPQLPPEMGAADDRTSPFPQVAAIPDPRLQQQGPVQYYEGIEQSPMPYRPTAIYNRGADGWDYLDRSAPLTPAQAYEQLNNPQGPIATAIRQQSRRQVGLPANAYERGYDAQGSPQGQPFDTGTFGFFEQQHMERIRGAIRAIGQQVQLGRLTMAQALPYVTRLQEQLDPLKRMEEREQIRERQQRQVLLMEQAGDTAGATALQARINAERARETMSVTDIPGGGRLVRIHNPDGTSTVVDQAQEQAQTNLLHQRERMQQATQQLNQQREQDRLATQIAQSMQDDLRKAAESGQTLTWANDLPGEARRRAQLHQVVRNALSNPDAQQQGQQQPASRETQQRDIVGAIRATERLPQHSRDIAQGIIREMQAILARVNNPQEGDRERYQALDVRLQDMMRQGVQRQLHNQQHERRPVPPIVADPLLAVQ